MAAKASPAGQTETPATISDEMDPQHAYETLSFLRERGTAKPIPQSCNTSAFYSHFFAGFIQVDTIQRGRISCTVSVKPQITTCTSHLEENALEILHGGTIGSMVELLSIACAKTVVADDKELFLGEISVSYLSGDPTNAEVLADASVVKSGRNVTMVALEFKLKKTGNLIYVAHATFYNTPVAKL